MPPAGPVFLSIPLNWWSLGIDSEPFIRTVSTTIAPDPTRLSAFAARIAQAKRVALVYGEEVDISLAWKPAIELAELLKAPVFQAPLASRAVFPETNPMFQGSLPIAQGPIGEVLAEFDLVLVVGAEVFRYYPWSPGPVLHSGTNLLQITEDPHDAGSARAGDSLLANAKLALEGLCVLLRNTTTPSQPKSTSTSLSNSSSSKTSQRTNLHSKERHNPHDCPRSLQRSSPSPQTHRPPRRRNALQPRRPSSRLARRRGSNLLHLRERLSRLGSASRRRHRISPNEQDHLRSHWRRESAVRNTVNIQRRAA